jgi:hypothetical protein
MEGEQNFSIRLAYSVINTSEVKEGLGKFKASSECQTILWQTGESS